MTKARRIFAATLALVLAFVLGTATRPAPVEAPAMELMTEDQQAQVALTQGWMAQCKTETGLQPGLGTWTFAITVNVHICLEGPLRAVEERDAAAALRAQIRELSGVPATPVTLIAAGDSITFGGNSVDGTGYRGYLADQLDQRGYAPSIAPVGGNGQRLQDIHTPTVAAVTSSTAVVILAIGTNDAEHNDPTFQARYAALVDAILAASSTVKVLIAKIPVPGTFVGSVAFNTGNPSALVTKVNTVNTAIAAVAAARVGGGRVAIVDAVPTPWLTDGGWHPGDAGYLWMARNWAAAIVPWLP